MLEDYQTDIKLRSKIRCFRIRKVKEISFIGNKGNVVNQLYGTLRWSKNSFLAKQHQ